MSREIREKKELTEAIQRSAQKNGCFMFGASYLIADALYNECYRKQEWVSVDERLPKQRELVLCIWNLENGCLNNYGFARYQGDNVWYVSNEGMPKVTHWMPLPEAPKMTRKEDEGK